MQYKIVTIQPNSGLQNANLADPIVSQQRLTIVPISYSRSTTIVSALPISGGTSTSISVQSGQQVTLRAAGKWKWGGTYPNEQFVGPTGISTIATSGFTLPGARQYSLIGRIGTTGAWFYIGSSLSFTANATGILYLGMNDDYYADNTGSLTVEVQLKIAPTDITAKIGTSPSFTRSVSIDENVNASGTLQIGATSTVQRPLKMLVVVDAPNPALHNADCPYANDKEPASKNPIELRTGNKIFHATDLTIESPAGKLMDR